MGVFLFYLAWILPFNEAPDEKMRYLVPTYIYRHGTLPAGWDEEVLNKMWGISYAFHPILPYILGGYLMRIVGIFNSSEHALLMAARCINVFFGMGFYWYVLKISRRLFQNAGVPHVFCSAPCNASAAFVPVRLCEYGRNGGILLCNADLWLDFSEWSKNGIRKSCTHLAVGVAVLCDVVFQCIWICTVFCCDVRRFADCVLPEKADAKNLHGHHFETRIVHYCCRVSAVWLVVYPLCHFV